MVLASEGCEDEDGRRIDLGGAFHATSDGPEHIVHQRDRYTGGPKGVLADARSAMEQSRLNRQADAVRHIELRRLATLRESGTEPAEASDSEDGETEEFRRYRLARLKELHAEARATAALPTYSGVRELSQDEYVAAVEEVDPSTFVVVLLHEPHLAPCVRLGLRLRALANKYDQVQFVSIRASEAGSSLGDTNLPALVAYRSGDYMESEVQVHLTLGEELPLPQLEQLIEQMGVRLTCSVAMRAADAVLLDRLRGEAGDDEDEAESEEED